LRFSNQSLIKVYTDGAMCPNVGISGVAAVFFTRDDQLLDAIYATCQYTTNNEAEYLAVLLALKTALQKKYRKIIIFTDSQIVVQQALGLACVRSPGLKKLHHELMMVMTSFEYVEFHHVPRVENQIADAFANEAISLWKRKANHESIQE
jgi:ribonuclease HI